MKVEETRIQFTASTSTPVTNEILDVVIEEEFPKKAKHISVVELGTTRLFPGIPCQVIELEVNDKAFGKTSHVDGADQIAFNMMYGLKNLGIDVTPEAVIIQKQGSFYRQEEMTVDFSKPRKLNSFSLHDFLDVDFSIKATDEPLKKPIKPIYSGQRWNPRLAH